MSPRFFGHDVGGARGLADNGAQDARAALPLVGLLRRLESTAPSGRLDPHAKVAHGVVEPEAVVETGGVPRAGANPFEAALVHGRPVVRGKLPVLTLRRERVGGSPQRHVAQEQPRTRPDIGALLADHEGQVSHEFHAHLAHPGARARPLLVGDPLEVLVVEYDPIQIVQRRRRLRDAPARDDLGSAVPFGGGPRGPAVPAAALAQGHVERQVGRPEFLLAHELAERVGPGRARGPLAGGELREGAGEHATFEGAHGVIGDARRLPNSRQGGLPVVAERLSDIERREVGDVCDRDVDRVEAEGGASPVWARLAVCQLVRRQDTAAGDDPRCGSTPRTRAARRSRRSPSPRESGWRRGAA